MIENKNFASILFFAFEFQFSWTKNILNCYLNLLGTEDTIVHIIHITIVHMAMVTTGRNTSAIFNFNQVLTQTMLPSKILLDHWCSDHSNFIHSNFIQMFLFICILNKVFLQDIWHDFVFNVFYELFCPLKSN